MKIVQKIQTLKLAANIVAVLGIAVACGAWTAAAATTTNVQRLVDPIAARSTWKPVEVGQVQSGFGMFTGSCGAVNRVFVGTVMTNTDPPTHEYMERVQKVAPALLVVRLDSSGAYLGVWVPPKLLKPYNFWRGERVVLVEPPAGCGQTVIAQAGDAALLLNIPQSVWKTAVEK